MGVDFPHRLCQFPDEFNCLLHISRLSRTSAGKTAHSKACMCNDQIHSLLRCLHRKQSIVAHCRRIKGQLRSEANQFQVCLGVQYASRHILIQLWPKAVSPRQAHKDAVCTELSHLKQQVIRFPHGVSRASPSQDRSAARHSGCFLHCLYRKIICIAHCNIGAAGRKPHHSQPGFRSCKNERNSCILRHFRHQSNSCVYRQDRLIFSDTLR